VEILGHPLIVAMVTGAGAGLVTWGALRTEIKFLWRDVTKLEKRLERMERRRGVRHAA
jgi:hypothetical protein